MIAKRNAHFHVKVLLLLVLAISATQIGGRVSQTDRGLIGTKQPVAILFRAQPSVSPVGGSVLNNDIAVDGTKYACSGIGINEAIAAIASVGGTVDARRCEGTITLGSTVVLPSSKQIKLILGAARYTGAANPLFEIDRASVLELSPGTVIAQTSTSSNGVILAGTGRGWIHGGIYGPGVIQGPGASISTATGVVWGGSNDPGNMLGNGAQETIIQDVVITGFNRGIRYGNNNYNTKLQAVRSYDNKIELIEPTSLNDTGEDLEIVDSTFANVSVRGNYVGCIQFNDPSSVPSSQIHMVNGSIDECQLSTGRGVHASLTSVHFENPNRTPAGNANPAATFAGQFTLTGVEVLEDNIGETKTSAINVAGGGGGTIVGGTYRSLNTTLNRVVNHGGSGPVEIIGLAETQGFSNTCVETSTGACSLFSGGVLTNRATTILDANNNGTFNSITAKGISCSIVSKSANYTATATDCIVLVNASVRAVTITIPSTISGQIIRIKKIDSSANSVIIVPSSGKIDGRPNATIETQYQSKEVDCDGTNCWVF